MTYSEFMSGSRRRRNCVLPSAAMSVADNAVRTALAAAVMLTMSIACSSANAQTTSISGSSFTGSQTFDATSGTAVITGNATLSANTTFNLGFQLNYLVVGGGGGGGGSNGGGGGGGAVVSGSTFLTGTANVSVGGGGGGGVGATSGTAGVNSTLLGTITGTGGQGGSATGGTGGASGNLNAGGNGVGGNGGGGGGAGAAGVDGNGGDGLSWALGDGTLYGAGGGGRNGTGGNTGGGSGGSPGTPGTAGFGAGGGGGVNDGGNGGSGTVQFAYLGSQTGSATNGTQSVGTGFAAGYTVVSFTNTGAGSYEVTSAQLAGRLAATLTGNLDGTGGLTFAGPGTLTLTGNNTYEGATEVTGGALIVNGSITQTSLTTVNSGAFLGGTGSIVNVVQILAGGTVSPGTAAATGILTVGGLDLQSSSTVLMQITSATPGTGYDKIVSTGNVDYAGATLQLQMSGTYADNTVFNLFDMRTVSGTLASINMVGSSGGWDLVTWYASGTTPGAGLYDYGEGVWQSSWATVGGQSKKLIFNQVSGDLLVVPEPSTFVMAGAGIASLAALRWRRQRRRTAAAREGAAASSAS